MGVKRPQNLHPLGESVDDAVDARGAVLVYPCELLGGLDRLEWDGVLDYESRFDGIAHEITYGLFGIYLGSR
ncbi:hypothetical protein ES703_16393 [subsurface metagenome]